MAVSTYVGSFQINTGGGTQTVDVTTYGGSSALPDLSAASAGTWAIMFWWSLGGTTPNTWQSHAEAGIGYTTGASNSYCLSMVSVDAQTSSITGRAMKAKAINFNYTNGGDVISADFTSMLAGGGFRLSFAGPGSLGNQTVNFMLINGLTGAKVLNWNKATGAGAQAVTGAGFKPDLVFHASNASNTLPYTSAHAYFGWGAMNKQGQQWSNSMWSQNAVATTNTSRFQQTDACLNIVDANDTKSDEAHFQSMDSDGFTVYFSTAANWGYNLQVISLCLQGVSSKIGAFVETAGSTITVNSRHGFTVRGALLSSYMQSVGSSPSSYATWSLGATDGVNQRAVAAVDADNVTTTIAKSIWHNSKVTVLGANISATTTSSDEGAWSSSTTSSFTLAMSPTSGFAAEGLYLLIGDSGSNTFANDVAAASGVTVNTATAYSNQKKLVNLSTNRKVAVYSDTGTNAKFKYSDDGITWTDYAADIAGWINGSVASYVDSGGTERLAAIWKQSGTGGSRTDGDIYLAVGSFNAGRTTLTWGTPIVANTDTNSNYPDLDCIANGTGGVVHVVQSINSGVPVGSAQWSSYTVSGNTPTLSQGAFTLGSNGSVNVNPFASICIDPSTSRVHIAWSKGQTGGINGIWYVPINYSSGTTWAIGTAVQVDSTRYIDVVGARWLSCRWNSHDSMVVIGGELLNAAGTHADLMQYESTNFTSFTTRTIAASADGSPGGTGALAIDPGTGDSYYIVTKLTTLGIGYYKWTRATAVLSTFVDTDDALITSTTGFVSALCANNVVQWVYTHGNNSPYTVKYDYIQLYNPSSGLTSPTSGSSLALNASGGTFKWSYYAPDSATQTGWAFKRIRSADSYVEYWNNGSTSWQPTEIYNSGATTSLTFASGKWPAGGSYSWTVSVQNATGVSGYAPTFTVSDSAAAAGVQTYVGSFTKQSGAGFQDITITPDMTNAAAGTWAIKFWSFTDGPAVSGTWKPELYGGMGFVANGGGTISQYSVATHSRNNLGTSSTHRRVAAKCLTTVALDGTTYFEADFVSFPSSTTMRINWTTDQGSSSAQPINYMIITGLTGAKVVQWTTPTSNTTKSVTGVGFKPDLAMNAMALGLTSLTSATFSRWAFGVFNKHGQQWANATGAEDASAPSNTSRWQQTDAALLGVAGGEGTRWEAGFVSMDTDGFTLNFTTNNAQAEVVITLCMQGVSSKVGAFIKSTNTSVPVSQSVTRVGFRPKGLLMSTQGTVAQSGATQNATWGVGASDGTNDRVIYFTDQDGAGTGGSPTTTQVKSVWYSNKSVIEHSAIGVTGSAGSVTSLDSDGFTLSWSSNDTTASEILYLAIGSANTNTAPDTIGTSTATTATAQGNQKKLAVLSTGRKVAVVGNTTTNAKFYYSDDGVTWTDYVSDIAGWANGSIVSLTIGSTEYLVATWRQSGTGGSRTDQKIYAMVGTFNTARSTLTWGTAKQINTNASVNYSYPDLVAIPSGNSADVLIVASCNSVSGSIAAYVRYSLDSSGNITNTFSDGLSQNDSTIYILSSTGAVSVETLPSIDYNPTTKDAYVAWTAGTTGAGKGIRFRKGTYSSTTGGWTWGTEVEIDNTLCSINTSIGLVCRFDGSVVIIAGVLANSSGASPFRFIYERDTADTTTTQKLMTSVAFATDTSVVAYPTVAIDQGTRDVYFVGGNYGLWLTKWQRSGGTVTSTQTDDLAVNGASPFANAFYNSKADRIEWIYTPGNNSPYAIKYDYIQLNHTPTVTLSTPADNFSVNLNTTAQNFAWTVSDADGDTQAKYVFRRRRPGASTYEYWTGSVWTSTLTEVVSTTNNVTITSNTWAGSSSYLWSVGVRDTSAASPIGYSAERTITNSAATTTVATYIGSFSAATTTGNQDVTIPVDLTAAASGTWAIVFYTSGNSTTSGTWQSHPRNTIGFTTGASNSYSASTGAADGQASSLTAKRMAAKAITISDYTAVVVSEADFVSFPTSTTMRINWTTNGAIAFNVNYMIITGLTNAKVVNWTTPTAVGTKSVAGVGFKPDLVLHAAAGGLSSLASTTEADFSFGMMNKHGQQVSNSYIAQNGVSPSNTSRWQQTDACFTWVGLTEAIYAQAHFQSMDSDGFTTYFSSTDTIARQTISLCLVGVSSKIGTFSAPASTGVTAHTTSHGFTVRGLMVSTFSTTPRSAPTTHALWSLGAWDGTNYRAAGIADTDNAGTGGSPSTTQSKSGWYNDTLLIGPSLGGAAPVPKATVSSTSTTQVSLNYSATSGSAETLYLLIGDSGTNTSPDLIGTSTSAAANAYNNQKRLTRLSTGRLVAVYNDGTPNAKFKYSDDGITWTDYSADIAGWSSGSITSYVDTGGTERLVVVWNQSGTGGGRTTDTDYVMVGTLSNSLGTLTWGPPASGGNSTTNFHDIVVTPESNGAVAWYAYASYNFGTVTAAVAVRVNIDPTGVPTIPGTSFTSTDYATTSITYPSIAIDPVSKRLHMAWTAGTTGAGKGVRYVTAAYTAGVWTFATEIEVDNTLYVSSTADWLVCRWDGTRALIMGNLHAAAATWSIMIYETTNFTSFTTRTLYSGSNGSTNSDKIKWYGSAAVDPATSDIYLFGQDWVGATWHYQQWVRATTTIGSVVTIETNAPFDNSTIQPFMYASGSTGKIDLIYTAGNNSPYPVKYNYIPTTGVTVTQVAPDAGARIDLTNNSQNFSWTFTDTAGNAQTAYIFRRRRDGYTAPNYDYWTGSAWTTTYTEVTSSTTNVTIAAGKWNAGKVYYWSVGVKDSAGSIGYSSERLITNTTATVGVYVGNFTKSNATGNQDITITPDLSAADAGSWAVIIWTAGSNSASGTWGAHAIPSLGFAANGGGTVSQYVVASFGVDTAVTSDTQRRYANKIITMVDTNVVTTYYEADFSGFPSANTMRLNWTTNSNGGGYTQSLVFNYMIITGLGGAKVINWTIPTSVGTKSATGVGFTPDFVFHSSDGDTAAVPANSTFGIGGIGMMNKYGQQASNTFAERDAVNPTKTAQAQQSDAAFVVIDVTTNNIYYEAQFVSMDVDGFTIKLSASSTVAQQIFSLALKGVSSRIGTFTSSSGPQTVSTNADFTARGGVFTTVGSTASGTPLATAIWSLGASDGTNHRAVALRDNNNISPAIVKSNWLNNAVYFYPNSTPTTVEAASVAFSQGAMTMTYSTGPAGAEIIYAVFGDAGTDTIPATVGTSTSSAATAYGNQRKLLTLSTGRLVAVYNDGTPNAKFKYSDDGITWTDYQADIAGFINGSISSYVDTGGTERIVAVWKQSGTGGSRTDAECYAIVGTLNTGRTTLTWGSAGALNAGSASRSYPDVVVTADGTGGLGYVVKSTNNGAGTNRVDANVLTISSSGTLSVGSEVTGLGGSYSLSIDTFPSIDINPTTKDLYAAWSAGTTGTGKGIRFRKGTYASSAWTWGTEVEIDNTVYVEANYSWLNCMFDGTRVIIGGGVYTGTQRAIILHERDINDTTTTLRYVSAAPTTSANMIMAGSMSYDQDGNVYFIGSSNTTPALGQYYKWTRSSATLGTLTNFDPGNASGADYVWTSVKRGYSGNKIEWVYVTGNNSPYAVKYQYISTVTADTDKKINRWGIIPI